MSRTLLLVSVVLLSVTGCTPKVATLEDRPDCTSSVEGYFRSPPEWTGDTPALIVKKGYGHTVLNGTVKSIDQDGIVFDEAQKSPTYDPDPKRYPNDKIVGYVDSTGNVERGELPSEESVSLQATLYVRPSSQPEAEDKRMTLEPNQRFGFCMSPDTYTVSQILFQYDDKVDKATRYGSIQLTVSPDSANYLGTLALNSTPLTDDAAYPIPAEPEKRPATAALSGMLFGLVGGIAHEIALEFQDVTDLHTLSVTRDSSFAPAASVPLQYSPPQVDPNETVVSKIDSLQSITRVR